MRIAILFRAALWCVLLSNKAIAQQEYTFEEACRLAGMTTGACAPDANQEKEVGCVKIKGNAFHAEKSKSDCIDTTLSPVLDAEIFVELIGLENIPKINELQLTIGRSAGFENAIALFYKGSRMIVLDPEWAKSRTAESYLVLAHEAGHHFCGHSLGRDPLRRKKEELEADRFSGASIKRFEVYHGQPFLTNALRAAELLYSEAGSSSYPARSARLLAIKLGYTSGSPCGGLAPAIPGFSPEVR